MAILTDQNLFSGTPSDNDLIHIVDVSDPTDNPQGSSFKIPLSGLTNYFTPNNYWVSGSTGNNSLKTLNITGTDATGHYGFATGADTLASGIASVSMNDTTVASGSAATSFGITTVAGGQASLASGDETYAFGYATFTEGNSTYAYGSYSHSGGQGSITSGVTSFAHGINLLVDADASAILGGNGNRLTNLAINSVILGGTNITGETANTVYTPNIINNGHIITGGQQVATKVDTGGVIYSVTNDDYYLRSTCLSANSTYNLPSSPPDGQKLIIYKNGGTAFSIFVNSPSASSIKACGNNSSYNTLQISGTNALVNLIYDLDLGAWVVITSCGGTLTYGTTI